MSCLYCSICVAIASSLLGISSAVSPKSNMGASSNNASANAVKPSLGEEENLDGLAVSVVEKSLEIFNLMSDGIKTSTRAGGDVRTVSLHFYFRRYCA